MSFIVALSLLLIVFCFLLFLIVQNEILKEHRKQVEENHYSNQLLQKSMLIQKDSFLLQKQAYSDAEMQVRQHAAELTVNLHQANKKIEDLETQLSVKKSTKTS